MTSKMARRDFTKVLEGVDRWEDIHGLIERCNEVGFWPEGFEQNALYVAKATFIRRLIRQQKGEDGWPTWHSVETLTDEGKTTRVYKQETFFNVEDYKQTFNYHAERSKYHASCCRQLSKNCRERFSVQLLLPFTGFLGTDE